MQGAFSQIQKINLLECPVGYKTFVIGMSICPYNVINNTYMYRYKN